MAYDVDAPSTIGPNWLIAKSGVTSLASTTDAVAMLLTSRSAETIDQLILPVEWAGASNGYGKLWAEVYDLADLGLPAAETLYTYVPNEDDAIGGIAIYPYPPGWGTLLTTGNGYTKVDDSSPDDSDFVIFGWGNLDNRVRWAFNSSTLPTTRRVLSVSFLIRAQSFNGSQCTLNVDLFNNTTLVQRLATLYPGGFGDTIDNWRFSDYIVGPLFLNPATGEPWLVDDIIAMDTGSNLMLQLGNTTPQGAVSQVQMIVRTVPEKRVAVGASATITSRPSGLQTATPILLKTPRGVDNWSKADAKQYLVVVRRLWDPTGVRSALVPSFRWVGDDPCPHLVGTEYGAVLGDASGNLTSAGSAGTKTYGLHIGRSDSAMSADSQPYYDITPQVVHASSTMEQGIEGADGSSYGVVRLVVGVDAAALPDAALTLKVRRTSDNVQMGGDASVTAADLGSQTSLGTHDGIAWYVVNALMSSAATLAAATGYYIEATSTAAAANAWRLAMLDFTETHSLTGNPSYGGATRYADLNGVSAAAYGDFAAVVSTVATAPPTITVDPTIGGVGAGIGQVALPDPGNLRCAVDDLEFARVQWGAPSPAMGAAFLRYEVQRSEDGGTTWVDIGTVSSEATLEFNDWEALRNTPLKYRVRSIRTDGAPSTWATQTGTITCQLTSPVVLFTSNADPTLCTGYMLLGGTHSYDFLEAGELVLVRMEGRKNMTAFKPLPEDAAGMGWSGTVLVFTDGNGPYPGAVAPSTPGWEMFEPLRAIARADLPYVCVLTWRGERLFAALAVETGLQVEPAHNYTAPFTVTQVADDPTVAAR